MATAEDSYLILSLLAQVEPRFSYAATSVHSRGRADSSSFARDPKRLEDELTVRTRLFGRHRPAFAVGDAWGELNAAWTRRSERFSRSVAAQLRVIESEHRIVHALVQDSDAGDVTLLEVSRGFVPHEARFYGCSAPENPAAGSAFIGCPDQPWAHGVALPLANAADLAGEHLLVIELAVDQGEVGAGLLTAAETDFVFRIPLKADPRIQELRIQVADPSASGRFVVHNWQGGGLSIVRLVSMVVFHPLPNARGTATRLSPA